MSGPPFLKKSKCERPAEKAINGEPQEEDPERKRIPFPTISAVVQIKPLLDGHISTLIMKDTHRRVSHAGRERTLCKSRGRSLLESTRKESSQEDRNRMRCLQERAPAFSCHSDG